MKTIPYVISDILSSHGAIITEPSQESLEYMAPTEIAEQLRIPEYGRLGFSYDTENQQVIPAYYDSSLFKAMKKFLSDKGRSTTAFSPPYFPNVNKFLKVVSSSTGFSNAIFRMGKTENSPLFYTLLFFKYEALADDKKEGIVPVLINNLNASTTYLSEQQVLMTLTDLKKSERTDFPQREEMTKHIQSSYRTASAVIEGKLKDFTRSLERRLNRDIKRVYEYYETLKKETNNLIVKVEKSSNSDEVKKLSTKLKAIETEQDWKVQDLISKYALKIEIEPFLAIHIETASTLFEIDIHRRNQSRDFVRTYNPILRRLDPLPCESCFFPRDFYYVCDRHLHIICGKCFQPCPRCAKKYCAACHPKGCPKCVK